MRVIKSVNMSQKIFNIDSRDGDGRSSRFRYRVELPAQHRFNRVCIAKVSLPKTWYAAQPGQNRFFLREEKDGKMLEFPVDITPANYNRRSLAIELAAQMTNASKKYGNTLTYSVTYPNAMTEPDDGKYTFHVSDEKGDIFLGTQPQIAVPGLESNMFELLGFDPNSTQTFVNGKLKSQNVIKVQSEDVIRIHSNVCDNGGNDILLELYSTNNPTFGTITWECPEVMVYSRVLANRTTNLYEFYITNESGVELDLNGLNWNFELGVFEV